MNHKKPIVGDTLLVIFAEPLPGKEHGPKLEKGQLKELLGIHIDKQGYEHYDVGLPLEIAYVTSFESNEELPERTHWCKPERFVLYNPAIMAYAVKK
jgi:hypothetical protein